MTTLQPRFGRVLAKVRSKHLKRHVAEARRFLREARQSTMKLNAKPKANNLWLEGANLAPVLEFLSS